ncbi:MULTISPECIES: 50S ribosomal protein L7ae-like protein [Clostridium]|uniref:50S ribosomal protein L7ae n=2 Tax=Clostridium botulinum TaxID=1491 RepID=A5I7L2_CLOBH|nr:50S ribosomal protein L7ae-like protein [Clostridium botulinum]EPS46837.1 ribosomal protein L7Ae family protein [Clostridium botulinum CFSAN002369]EPS47996.1 ribosomal protein L7Ae family protein [Clostridium botulinum CFSAN002367]ABS32904.1 ribosomal protein L7Ae family protein [Clostridium botulinum A str. ATCC 19397]ABS38749.1 ribosomal protein L7Ae family protein [Clostridium botulinum A str. Hall]APQ71465.1 RNA 2'-O ribose methyltransferase substrate binding family protein [Clostridium
MIDRLKGNKVVGVKQTVKALKNNTVKTLYVSKDADESLIKPLIELAEENSIDIIKVDTMKELGRLCGIDVSAATAALLK